LDRASSQAEYNDNSPIESENVDTLPIAGEKTVSTAPSKTAESL
jgi:hypothetical protein